MGLKKKEGANAGSPPIWRLITAATETESTPSDGLELMISYATSIMPPTRMDKNKNSPVNDGAIDIESS